MKFGKVSSQELDQLALHLPEEHPITIQVLQSLNKSENPKVSVGCAKWGRPEWVGLLYPEGTKDKDFLENYVKHFNSIELNSTFYGAKRSNMERWAEKGVEGFKFCPKVTRHISHLRRLKDAQDFVDYWFDAITSFGENLGPSFLQLPENFGPKRFDVFQSFIENLPEDAPLVVELRHPDWFQDEAVNQETFTLLKENKIGTAITDVGGRRDCLNQPLTTDTAFIRFNGYDLHPSDYSRMDEWVDRIDFWINQGVREVYFFAHQEDEKHTPATADYFIEKINKKCGLEIKRPQFIS